MSSPPPRPPPPPPPLPPSASTTSQPRLYIPEKPIPAPDTSINILPSSEGNLFHADDPDTQLGYGITAVIVTAIAIIEIGVGAGACACQPYTFLRFIGSWWGSLTVVLAGGLGIAAAFQDQGQKELVTTATVLAGIGFVPVIIGLAIDSLAYYIFWVAQTAFDAFNQKNEFYPLSESCAKTLLASAVLGGFSMAATLTLMIYGSKILCDRVGCCGCGGTDGEACCATDSSKV